MDWSSDKPAGPGPGSGSSLAGGPATVGSSVSSVTTGLTAVVSSEAPGESGWVGESDWAVVTWWAAVGSSPAETWVAAVVSSSAATGIALGGASSVASWI